MGASISIIRKPVAYQGGAILDGTFDEKSGSKPFQVSKK
jgi:hypothetical protein